MMFLLSLLLYQGWALDLVASIGQRCPRQRRSHYRRHNRPLVDGMDCCSLLLAVRRSVKDVLLAKDNVGNVHVG